MSFKTKFLELEMISQIKYSVFLLSVIYTFIILALIAAYCYEIINQSYTNIEVICVDDGSTDCSHEILKSFSRKDNRFWKIIHVYHLISIFRNDKKYSILKSN